MIIKQVDSLLLPSVFVTIVYFIPMYRLLYGITFIVYVTPGDSLVTENEYSKINKMLHFLMKLNCTNL